MPRGKNPLIHIFLEREIQFNSRLFNNFGSFAINSLHFIDASYLGKESMLIDFILDQETVSHFFFFCTHFNVLNFLC